MPKVAAAYCIHDDIEFFSASVKSVLSAVSDTDIYAFVSHKTWSGSEGDVGQTLGIAKQLGIGIEEGYWESEIEHRRAIHDTLKAKGYDYVITIDSDEVLEPDLLAALLRIAESDLADRIRVTHDTYWHSHAYRIRPRERLALTMMVSLSKTEPNGLREFAGGREIVLPDTYGLMHHLSYAGAAARIQKKITSWSHRDEVVTGWFDSIWRGWEDNKLLRDLHPTLPVAYGFAERISPPQLLIDLLGEVEIPPLNDTLATKPSVVIPVFGGSEDLRDCLESLVVCKNLVHEVIVVDNASPDDSLSIAKAFDDVTIIENGENKGFAAACNQGAEIATSPYILFLNSDTIIGPPGLTRLVEALERSTNIAAAGPYSNYAGYAQQLQPTYTELANIRHFVADFATRNADDIEVDHLVGFCILVRKAVFDEIGHFDESFGIGLFEDTDLCYRMLRAWYKLRIAARSFVHHHGSRSLSRAVGDPEKLLHDNQQRYLAKWSEDVECGFASHLPSTSPSRVVFHPERMPEERRKAARKLAEQVGISLCMIVKNEERVLSDCLRSVLPFFSEIIIVDTGSTDGTVEIARSFGADVFDFPWTNSFAEARNESLTHAHGKWVFWLDADDTISLRDGETILEAVATASDNVVGFVVPVQFVDDGPDAGTRVDHIKLFRNLAGLQFEGRIHEQILPSLRKAGGDIARCNAVVHHSGYDTSADGQASKRERDFKLLELDYQERPDHPFVLFNLGMTHHYTGSYEEAIKWLRLCIEKSQDSESHKRKAYVHLAQALRALNRNDEAFDALVSAFEKYPDDQEIPFQLGIAHTERKEYDQATDNYLKALAASPGSYFSSLDVGLAGHMTLHNLGLVARLRGAYVEARDWWRKAYQASPSQVQSLATLFEYALEVGDFSEAKNAMETVRRLEGESVTFVEMLYTYNKHISGDEAAIASLASSQAGQHNSNWSLVLARKFLNSGRLTEAMPILLQLVEAGRAEAAYHLGVLATRSNDFRRALAWMEKAHGLNPEHQPTIEQIANLRRAIEDEEDLDCPHS